MMVLTVCRFEWVRRDIAILMVALMVVMLTVMTGVSPGWWVTAGIHITHSLSLIQVYRR